MNGKRRNALADYGRMQARHERMLERADAASDAPRNRGALLLWLGLAAVAIVVFALLRSPGIG